MINIKIIDKIRRFDDYLDTLYLISFIFIGLLFDNDLR